MRRAPFVVVAALVLWLGIGIPPAFAARLHVDLVTVGPGSDDLSLYGHSALCLIPDGADDGRCYDFGVPSGNGEADALVWDTLRGKPRFVPVAVERSRLVATYEDLERSLWVEELPLDDIQAAELRATLENAVASRQPYAYHPYYDNCTTRLRDVIDQVTGGKLGRDGEARASGPTFRALSEQGFSGHVLELAGLALFLGTGSDRTPSAWERMFLPVDLRDAVASRLGAPAQAIYVRRAAPMRTSTQAGHAGLLLLGVLLAFVIVVGARRGARPLRIALACVGLVLGLLGLSVDAVSLLTRIPEFSSNWVALVVLPTDVVLGFVRERPLLRYLGARLVLITALAALSVTRIIVQPLWAVCLFAALPLAASYLFVLPRKAAES